ncbi:MAG TPA: LLM class F420-dependent oxidoreductase, partial [Pseudonocardia sp.]|uniref:LLM class F420-dependent oxidoreductase n=1 Tax=Pseudonocardia sp. TaxID=60912 RepID=UPI002EDA3154
MVAIATIATHDTSEGAPVRLGVTVFLTDLSINPVRLAREVEARGFHSVYFPEHTHIPVARETPHPVEGHDFDPSYRRTLDPYIALAAASSVTERILLGTGVGVVAQHDPIILAKELATLDYLSGGRLVLGIGYGWNKDEIANHGIDPARRRGRLREVMLAMTEIWSHEVAEYHGKHVELPPSWSWPKPVQQPRPRALIGGPAGPKLFGHIAEFADGWMPIGSSGFKEALPLLRAAFADAGRDPDSAEAVPFGVLPSPGKLEYLESLGVREAVLALPKGGADEVLPVLDAYAAQFGGYLTPS